ncbi:MAG: DUF6157 family protein [Cytophagaceae bacterium]|jgi:hypothetical protein|nr:DUF6157 family protein [Cytophagaceae bacterium]
MKVHTTNYYNTFIEIAEDCPEQSACIPPAHGQNKTVAQYQFELISKHPYAFTSDEILFNIFAERNDLSPSEIELARVEFFSKGQACFRASPLTKRYGFGVHADKEGKMALYGCETKEYKKMVEDPSIKKVKAMRSSKK